jgi:radical SAM protein with 4Fe4S-binding SPASM domain
LVRTAKENGIDVAITTNGTIGNRELWKEILPHLTWIKFSVDAGTPEIYSKVHNISEGFFDKTLNSIREAVRIKKENNLDVTVGVQFLIIEENLKDVQNALDLFSTSGIDYFVLKPYSLHPQMLKKKNTIYTPSMINFLQDVIDEYRSKSDMSIVFRRDALEKYENGEKSFKHCYALPFWGYISTKGDFYTCSVFIGDERFRVGNIYENDMQMILFGERRKKSLEFGSNELIIENECRVNCRMARANEFLKFLSNRPEHINFI